MNNKQSCKNWCPGLSSFNLCKDHVDHHHELQRLKSESGETFQKRQVSVQFLLKFCQDRDHVIIFFLPRICHSGGSKTRGFAPGSLKETVGTSYRHVISYLVSYPSIYVVVICSTIHQHALLPYVASSTNISIFYMQHNLLICLAATYSTTYQCTVHICHMLHNLSTVTNAVLC
jgi:hypothetical protein